MGKMALRGKAELETDVGDRGLRAHQPVEGPLDAHGVGVKRRRQPGVLAEQLEEMRTRKADVACHRAELDALWQAVIEEPQRFANAKVDGSCSRTRRLERPLCAQESSKQASKSSFKARSTTR